MLRAWCRRGPRALARARARAAAHAALMRVCGGCPVADFLVAVLAWRYCRRCCCDAPSVRLCACVLVHGCVRVGAAAAGARNISDPNMYNGARMLWAYMIVTADR